MSGKSDTGTNLLPETHTGSLEFGFKLIVFSLLLFSAEKCANFIHRQGATDYKAHG